MPGLTQRNEESNDGAYSVGTNVFWSKTRDDVSYNQLQKFWSELSPSSRQKLLRVDKQTLFEQARKNMYCSRCNGLLLEGFLQIVMYGKSMHQGEGYIQHTKSSQDSKNQVNDGLCNTVDCFNDEIQDPSNHPWGGLMVIRDGSLTLLDCYLYSKTLKGLQTVFDSARGRERERELLYPDACGGGARGWISQGVVSYARTHGTRESCALHTARLSCDTLVDFWSALGEETRQSLSRMKEEDFIERLMYRFESKRFCRDCRRNVIREFKELKELKRMRRETRCTTWFCVADTAFQYEVSEDTIQADWCQTFADSIGLYHHFEWGVGTGEGKTDILGYENVGMNGSVYVSGLNLGGLNACFITLRAWKLDGRCSEICVKAHALKGKQCIHCRLIVGDGFVAVTREENIRQFFEHAEEAEEDEDDDSIDKDVNDPDGECSRPQRHAKSPELAREFLLDAATVIFKEQVEKAFREGTARQNSHSIFVCLALKLLEERVHVACKEIITLEKQTKLLEEEEKEKREEEERRERKRTKERERKLRRRERLKGKEKEKGKNQDSEPANVEISETAEEHSGSFSDSLANDLSISSEIIDEDISNDYVTSEVDTSCDLENQTHDRNEIVNIRKDFQPSQAMRWPRYVSSEEPIKKSEPKHCSEESDSSRSFGMQNRHGRSNGRLKFHSQNNKINESYSCSCHQQGEYRVKTQPPGKVTKSSTSPEIQKQFYRMSKPTDSFGRPKTKHLMTNGKDLSLSKKVWEPTDPWKKYPRSISDSDVSLKQLDQDKLCLSSEASLIEVKNCVSSMISDNGIDTSSTSDNSSLSLGEGDSCPSSSNFGTIESSSTSDTDEGKEVVASETKLNGFPMISTAVSGGLEHQVLYTPLPSQHMQYSMFQAPSAMSYYPQNQVSYLPYSNHHLYSGGLEFRINANPPLCFPCGTLQGGNPSVNPTSLPIYHPISQTIDPTTPASEKSVDPEGSNFSLFHFGGPVELSNRCNMDSLTPLSKFIEKIESDPPCGKETKIEEYNLFAESNSMRFSIF